MADALRATYARVRGFRRIDPPRWPFVWRGLLPLLGLLALAVFAVTRVAHGWIEDAVRDRTRAALDGAGLGWVGLEVSGQRVWLSGAPPAPADGDRALEVARQARCPSWAGGLICAVSVSGAFAAASAEVAPPAAPAAAPAAEAPPATPAAPDRAAAQACEGGLGALLTGSTVEFASGSAILAPSAAPLLDRVAELARTCPGVLRVEGHTDATGDPARNLELSRARAEAVRGALVSRGLSAERLQAEGFGPTRPVASNADAAGRSRNRRIELHVVPGP
jgi:outer membrane protein OmpA-like peptidoglycan-associated protein